MMMMMAGELRWSDGSGAEEDGTGGVGVEVVEREKRFERVRMPFRHRHRQRVAGGHRGDQSEAGHGPRTLTENEAIVTSEY